MVDIDALRAEISGNATRYGGFAKDNAGNAALAANINAKNVTVVKESMSGGELMAAVDNAELEALTETKLSLWVSFTRADDINPGNANNVSIVKSVFGAGSKSLTALNSARDKSISRAEKIRLGGEVGAGHVAEARK